MPHQRAGYDSPTQCGDSDDYDDWDRYNYDYENDSDSSRYERDSLHEWNERSSPSFQPSRNNSGLSFSVLNSDNYDDESPPLGDAVTTPFLQSSSPTPLGDTVFSPLTPSNGLPLTPLPSLHEWFLTGQPVYDILTLPVDNPPVTPAQQQSLSSDILGQQPAAGNEARGSSVHSLTLSQFFDAESVREISATLAEYQSSEEPGPEEASGFDAEEPEERFILREEDIHMSAIRDRSVLEMRFAREMPPTEVNPTPEADPAAAPQPGYVPPEEFEPPYAHPPYVPPANEGRLPYQSEPFSYLTNALQMHPDQLKWCLLHRPMECFHHLVGMTVYCIATKRFSTVAHLTALTPATHVSVTGTSYFDYLRNQCGFTVSAEYKSYPMLELGDNFLAPLESLILYWHV